MGQIDENTVRGLVSIASGEVDCIEDIAAAIKFDEDVAEGLSFVAASVTMDVTYSQLMSSASLNKICGSCGLPLNTIAALLAIVNQDYRHGFQISKALPLLKIDARYLQSIMAMYCDEDIKSPITKRDFVEAHNIQPLSSLYGIDEVSTASSIIRLVQGDVGVIRTTLAKIFKWDKSNADVVTALAMLLQPLPLDMSPAEHKDWDDTRDAGVACTKICKLLKYDENAMVLLVAAARGGDHGRGLNILAKRCGIKSSTLRDMMFAIAGVEVDNTDVVMRIFYDSKSMIDVVIHDDNGSDNLSVKSGDSSSTFKLDELLSKSTEKVEKTLAKIYDCLSKYSNDLASSETNLYKPLPKDFIEWLLGLLLAGNWNSNGSFTYISKITEQMRISVQEHDMNPNCTTENVALVLSIASAKMFQLEQLKHLDYDRQSESYMQLGVDEYPGLTFLMNVAQEREYERLGCERKH